MVEPVAQIPVADLEECIVGTLVSLANGSRHFAMVSNIDAHRPERNAHFVGLTFFRDDKRFFLRRYHDVGYDSRGPVALAAFLGLTVSDIFPIAYDVGTLIRAGPYFRTLVNSRSSSAAHRAR